LKSDAPTRQISSASLVLADIGFLSRGRGKLSLERVHRERLRFPLSTGVSGRSRRVSNVGHPGSLEVDFRKPNRSRDPESPCSARRPEKQAWDKLAFSRLRLTDLNTH
jgi:hypothetical protein